jgi:protein-S-isoprenylcysteine O-methyltransferase Ste14
MSATPSKSSFGKRYKELAARSRVPLGFLLLIVYAIFSRPSWERLIAGALVALCGLALRAWATGHLDKNRELCTGGPYAHTRNPLYLGTALAAAGFAIAGGQWWIAGLFALVLAFVYWPVVIEEESYLHELFPAFGAYAERVPRFWPALRAAWPSDARFRMALYRKNQEYNAAVGYVVGVAVLLWKTWR